jgi:gliding motility-associated-like protein
VESPAIAAGAGQWAITMNFKYAAGQNFADRAFVVYSADGVIWQDLAILPQTGECAPGSIEWDDFSIGLPASANNNANYKIGFRWENNSDGVVAPVSVAIDDIELVSGPPPVVPVANFEVTDGVTQFCENNCTSFTSTTVFDPTFSNGAATATYAWSFPGGTPATSDLQNPVVCYEDPGVYSVTLTVTDNIGESAPATQANLLTIDDCGPVIAISASSQVVCANEQCIDFTDLSTGNDVNAWLWTFESASGFDVQNSILQNPTNICLNEVGFYNVTLQATDLDGTESQTFSNYIEVLDCSGPDIDFSANRLVICPGECIQLTDESTSNGTITAWNWTLPGGQAEGEALPGVSTQQNPVVCYSAPGSYNITLSATDQEGPSAITKTITIIVDPCTGPPEVNIGASETVICTGDCVDFFDQSLGLVEDYLWVFQGIEDINDITSDEENPSVICYPNPGVFDVTLTVSNSNNEIDSQTFVDFITVEQCINPPVPRIEVSTDTICAGECVDYFSVSTGIGISNWSWNFQGADPGSTTSMSQNPTGICYSQTGTYSVSLTTSGAGGDSTRVFSDVITVVSSPECRPQIETMFPDTLCAGDCAAFPAIIENADSVRWTFQGGNPETSTAFNPGVICFEEIGDYIILLEAWNAAGPSQPIVANVFVGERPDLDAGPNRTINAGSVIQLTASVGEEVPLGEFLWQPFDYVDDFTAQTVTTSPLETTDYIVYYKEEGTCTAVDTVTVTVNFVAAVGVPTAFSPNGDGENDLLYVLGQGISKMKFQVFDRYGLLVFDTQDQSMGWDGNQNGIELNPGTFVYTLDVTFSEGRSETFTGNVTLVR